MKTINIAMIAALFLSGCQKENQNNTQSIKDSTTISQANPLSGTASAPSGRDTTNTSISPLGSSQKFDAAYLKQMSEFIPQGWVLSDSATGKINTDAFNDLVLIVEKDNTEDTVQNYNYAMGDFGLIILAGTADAKYTLQSINLKALNNREGSGRVDGQGEIAIHKNIISYCYWQSGMSIQSGNIETCTDFRYSEEFKKMYVISQKDTRYPLEGRHVSKVRKYKIMEVPLDNFSLR